MRCASLLLLAAPVLASDEVVFLAGENEYGSHETLPALAEELERRIGIEADVRHGRGQRMPDLDGIEDAQLLVLFLRFREPTSAQAAVLERWFAAGKPAIALRTTSHAFGEDLAWFPPRFGGHYKGHAPNDWGTTAVAYPPSAEHPILRGVPRVLELEHGGTYDALPLEEGATPLMFGRSGDLPAQPVAWTFEGRFTTTLGTREDFADEGFRELLANAVLWGLGKEVPAEGAFGGAAHPPTPLGPPLPAPPAAQLPEDAVEVTAWHHYEPSLAPRAMQVDERADTSPGGSEFDGGRWPTEAGVLVARPGFGDLVSDEEYADYHLHLDFLVPREPAWVPDGFRGASGVYLAGRYEVQLVDSWAKDTGDLTAGALYGERAPQVNAAREPGTWQSLDVAFSHHAGEPARLSAWLNDVRVLDAVTVEEATPYGFLAPVPGDLRGGVGARHVEATPACDWGRDEFSVYVRFRGEGDGSLVSRCPPEGEWVPDAKVLFLRDGRLVYDIGWVGALSGGPRVADGEWHGVVLSSRDGHARLFLDGDLIGERRDFRAEDGAAFVSKIGAANENFGGDYDGEVVDVRFYHGALDEEVAAALSDGEDPDVAPAWGWDGGGLSDSPMPSGTPLPAPIRLQADTSPVRFANIWVAPLGEVDHAGLIATWDDAAYGRGEEIYQGLCRACHGDDGLRTLNPKARAFATSPLQNGADPLSLFRTVSDGYQDMPSNLHLTPAQRYDVIHYVRERFLAPQNPSQYMAVDSAYLAELPRGLYGRADAAEADELPPRDFGPALASQLERRVGAALSVRLDGDATMTYDLQTMRVADAWTGGFLDLSETQHYQQRGEGEARPGGEPIEGLDAYAWGFGGTLDWDRDRRPDRGLLPTEWLDYHGHYVHGDQLVLAYAVDGREVRELPGVDRSSGLAVFTHRLSVGAGAAELVLGVLVGGSITREVRPADDLGAGWSLLLEGDAEGFVATALLGGGAALEVDGEHGLVRFGPEASEVLLLRFAGSGEAELAALRILLDNVRERRLGASPVELTRGGPPRWHALTTVGTLGEGAGAYALDTVALPEANPWNAWVRTSAIAFFEDGRAAVTTYGGDVWIVSGLDADLDEVTWRRFAAGLFEPMGAQVVDGKVVVTARDRLVRLHDLNGDGEADFYESFFADPDVSHTFHAFNFDLQVDGGGNLFYAKAGQYTSYALPGAVIKVDPSGESYEVHCTGLRTPNGMGILPDGRVTVSDNQGNWIPASKVSLTKEGGFYGVFKAINIGGPGEQTREEFDQPVIWMPQSFDSSSGGQLYVDDERWGPLAGRLLHTSFGRGWLYPMTLDERGATVQAAIWRLPFQFAAGLQRARVNPADGQVWGVGLSGWQGPAGGEDGCLQRLRYTGEPETMLLDARVGPGRIDLEFSGGIDPEAAADLTRYRSRRWDYHWARQYGSAHYSVSRPGEEGEDEVAVVGTTLSADGRRLSVHLSELVPCDQVELRYRLEDEAGAPLEQRVFLTVHEVPEE